MCSNRRVGFLKIATGNLGMFSVGYTRFRFLEGRSANGMHNVHSLHLGTPWGSRVVKNGEYV